MGPPCSALRVISHHVTKSARRGIARKYLHHPTWCLGLTRKMSTESVRQGHPDFRPDSDFYAALPTFSTGTESTPFVPRPNFDIFLNIVFSGKCNTGIRTEPDMKPSEFIEGALHATSEVTGAMADGNLETLKELMTSECLAGAREGLRKLTPTQRVGLEVLKEDVILSWVGKSMKNLQTGESRLLFAVTSLPAKGWISRNRALHKEKFREDIVEKVVDKGQHNPEYMEREMLKFKEEFAKNHGSVPQMKDIDFRVTNVEFTRVESTSSWRISSVSTKSGKNLKLDPLSLFKWRFRMAIFLNARAGSPPFMSLLRWDMATDLLLITMIVASLFNTLGQM